MNADAELSCPSREQLERLLFGAMPDAEMEELKGHLSGCISCLEVMRAVTTEDALVLAVRAGARAGNIATEDADPDLLARLCRLHASVLASRATLTTDADRTEELCGLLAPPQEPDELGRFGPYGILRPLGSGGMGAVFAARQTQPRRIVALKMILAARGGRQRLARFRSETEIIAQLQHPNIVPVYEVGDHEGRPYYTMEYLDGGNLTQKLAAAPLAPRAAAELALVLARAVQFAHERGVVHRDLKPANILLSAEGTPKIADFGLAKQFGSEPGEPGMPNRTESGAILGTPGYMAPEQATGSKDIGPPADIYALGAILYECLTGRPPFRAATVLETLEQVRSQEPAPISRLQPKTPRDLQTICQKCLHKEPGRRYASAAALADDLDRFLRGEPIRARPVSTRERLWKWARRKPGLTALLATTGVLVLVLIVGSLVYNARLRDAIVQAEAKEAEARQQRELAASNYQAARDALDRMLRHLEQRRLGEVPLLKELQREQCQDALAFYEGILSKADNPDPEVRLDAARACERAANIQTLLGRSSEVEANYRRAIDLIEALPAPQRDLLQTQRLLAVCYSCLGAHCMENLTDAQRHVGKALTIAERLAQTQPDDPLLRNDLARIKHQLAQRYIGVNKWADAEPLCIQAVDLRTALVRDYPKEQAYQEALAEDYVSLGLIYGNTGRGDKVIAAYTKVEELLLPLIARDPEGVRAPVALAATCVNWGLFLIKDGQRQSALDRVSRAIELADAVRRREPNLVSARGVAHNAHALRAKMYEDLGRWADAVKDREAAAALADKQNLLINRSMLAADLVRMGDHRGATAEVRAVVEEPGAGDHMRYNAACVYSLAIPLAHADTALSPNERDATAERYAAAALAVLGRLKADGYFHPAQRIKLLQTDSDLQPLRERADYRRLFGTK